MQLLIRRWNARLSRDILAHWLDLLSADGWIAREQVAQWGGQRMPPQQARACVTPGSGD